MSKTDINPSGEIILFPSRSRAPVDDAEKLGRAICSLDQGVAELRGNIFDLLNVTNMLTPNLRETAENLQVLDRSCRL